jgi:FkbM family methyltransferase
MGMKINNFVALDSIHGQFIVPRTCTFQAEALVKTGRTHIETELNNIFAIVDTLPKDSIIVDGGANAGFFTIPVAHRTHGRDIRIISFEPQRQLFQALGGSLALNGYHHVYLHNCGLAAEPGIAQLPVIDYSVAQDFGTVQLTDDCTVEESGWMNNRVVDVTSIDTMDLPRLDFFKLDVEGYEVPALTGALTTIEKHRPWIWVEYFITGVDSIKQSLTTIPDYKYYIVDYQNMLCVPQSRANCVNVSGLQQA